VVTHAWEAWKRLGLDEEDREQTAKSVRDAAANVYTEDMDDEQWFQATVARLRGER
jgi:hypothetical protein